ncbi:uncharacterized protein UDID_17977 [Ustilago sp. UG-2017a]|nr:uncharacterized protein UDID_17977 [Ustilago sp. UG-2017a]
MQLAEQCYRITRLSAGGVAAAPVKLLARSSTAKRLTHTCAKEGGPPNFGHFGSRLIDSATVRTSRSRSQRSCQWKSMMLEQPSESQASLIRFLPYRGAKALHPSSFTLDRVRSSYDTKHNEQIRGSRLTELKMQWIVVASGTTENGQTSCVLLFTFVRITTSASDSLRLLTCWSSCVLERGKPQFFAIIAISSLPGCRRSRFAGSSSGTIRQQARKTAQVADRPASDPRNFEMRCTNGRRLETRSLDGRYRGQEVNSLIRGSHRESQEIQIQHTQLKSFVSALKSFVSALEF